MISTEQLEINVKLSFMKAKEEITALREEIVRLRLEIEEIRKVMKR
jgi:hypothetical protein